MEPKYDLKGLLAYARVIWGNDFRQELPEIVIRLMVGVGDLARLARELPGLKAPQSTTPHKEVAELKKELGNIIFSTIRWCDDLGFSPAECVEEAIHAQKRFAASGKPR